jgi:hypothetical protein
MEYNCSQQTWEQRFEKYYENINSNIFIAMIACLQVLFIVYRSRTRILTFEILVTFPVQFSAK